MSLTLDGAFAVYFGSDDGKFYCVNSYCGGVLWSYQTGGMIRSSASLVEEEEDLGVVYFGSDDSKVYSLNATNGSLIWSYETGSYVRTTPNVTDEHVYIGSGDGKLYSLSAEDGEVQWSYSTGHYAYMPGFDHIDSSPAVVSNVVYFGAADEKLYALKTDSLPAGQVKWSYRTSGEVVASPVVYEGRVFFGSLDAKFYSLEQETGDLVWSYAVGNVDETYRETKTRFDPPDTWVPEQIQNGMRRFNATDGSIYSSPSVNDGVIFFGSRDRHVYALMCQNGDLRWSYETQGWVDSKPMLTEDSHEIPQVFVGSWDKKMYVIDLEAGPPCEPDANGNVRCVVSDGSYIDDDMGRPRSNRNRFDDGTVTGIRVDNVWTSDAGEDDPTTWFNRTRGFNRTIAIRGGEPSLYRSSPVDEYGVLDGGVPKRPPLVEPEKPSEFAWSEVDGHRYTKASLEPGGGCATNDCPPPSPPPDRSRGSAFRLHPFVYSGGPVQVLPPIKPR